MFGREASRPNQKIAKRAQTVKRRVSFVLGYLEPTRYGFYFLCRIDLMVFMKRFNPAGYKDHSLSIGLTNHPGWYSHQD